MEHMCRIRVRVWLQGYIPGASFAHSLVSHTKLQAVDEYLKRIDRMPDTLKTCKVMCRFMRFTWLRLCVQRPCGNVTQASSVSACSTSMLAADSVL